MMAIGFNRLTVVALAAVAALSMTVLACGGDGDDGTDAVPSPTSTEEAPISAVADPTATPVIVDELAQIHQAALDWVDGVLVAQSSECVTSNRSCVEMLPALPASAAQGMVRLIGADPQGGGSGWIVLGKHADGSWGVLMAGNNLMPATVPAMLEGEPLGFVCDAAEGLNVRSEPNTNAAILGTLEEGAEVHIEAFVLEAAATDTGIGTGWYEISAPVAGWISSDYVSNVPTLLTCLGNYTAS